jgi:hypothetical protein
MKDQPSNEITDQNSDKIPDESSAKIDQDTNMQDQRTQMTTLSGILESLRLKKLDNEFRWTPEGFTAGKGKVYSPDQLTIIKTFRFEGESDPSDAEILYIIKANDGLIGYSIDAYGMYSNHEDEQGYDNFIRKIPMSDRDEQLTFEI